MTSDRLFDLHRLRYWEGQRLRSRDLNDQVYFDAHLRAWHNRALHEAYGVASGLQVALDPAAGLVVVEPGFAYDARGRILYLPRKSRLAWPDDPLPASGYFLVLQDTSSFEVTQPGHAQPACSPGSPGAGISPGRLAWERTTGFNPRSGVALARLDPGPVLAADFSAIQARPLARPQVAQGSTIPGRTAWRPWTLDRRDSSKKAVFERVAIPPGEVEFDLSLGLQVDVDTSAAGFTGLPCYFAWLEGSLWEAALQERVASSNPKGLDPAASIRQVIDEWLWLQLLAPRFGHLYRSTARGFTYRLWLPQVAKWIQGFSLLTLAQQLAQSGRLTVAWVGIANQPGCEPEMPDSARPSIWDVDERECYGSTR